jgi:amino acid transporter
MAAFKNLFETFHMPWAIPIIAVVITFGALGQLGTWIVGPSRGLHATIEQGDLPPIFHKVNEHNMPVHIFIAQAIIVSILSLVFLFMPTVGSSYWILLALTSLLYMLMYILMFISAIVLRYTHPDTPRNYHIPYGHLGMWTASILGIIGASFGILISFFPPSQLNTGSLVTLEIFLVGTTLVFCIAPLLIFAARKPHWRKKL